LRLCSETVCDEPRNNVFIAERDNAFGRDKAAHGRGNTNPALTWTGYTPAVFEGNVVVVDNSNAPSRDGWFGGRPCAGEGLPAGDVSPHCTYDTFDNFWYSNITRNVYFNRTSGSANPQGTTVTPTFPGGCNATELGACAAKPPARTSYNGAFAGAILHRVEPVLTRLLLEIVQVVAAAGASKSGKLCGRTAHPSGQTQS
jgi:hypothetical protein